MTKARDLANAADVLDDVSATELSYVNGVTSAIQTQIDGKQAVVSGVNDTEIGYLDGVTSAIQTQLDSKIGSASAINPTIVDAKGDLIVGSAADTVARLAVGTNGYILTADSAEAGGVKWATPVSGKVLQVVSATTTTSANITSTSYTDTNITATITPTSSTSKILVLISAQNLGYWSSTNTVFQAKAQLLRGATQILEDLIFAQLEGASAGSGYKGSSSSITYLDSPATTSSTTYKLQAAKVLGNGIYFQGSNSNASTITLLEIGA